MASPVLCGFFWPSDVDFSSQFNDSISELLLIDSESFVMTPASVNPLTGTFKLHSNGSLYSNTVISTLAVDGWAVTFRTTRRLERLQSCPGPSSLYQMQQPTHQRPVYQLHINRCGNISSTCANYRVNIEIKTQSLTVVGHLCQSDVNMHRTESHTAAVHMVLEQQMQFLLLLSTNVGLA